MNLMIMKQHEPWKFSHVTISMNAFTFYVSLMSVNYIIRSAGALICKLTEMMAIASITIIDYNLFLDQSEPFEL